MTAVIEVDGLQKRYGDNWAVRDASFEVRAGEVFGILGRNGAGKTTTVECLQGLRTPTAGTMRVLGSDPRSNGDLGRRVGSQLQDAALPDRIRVAEAVRLFALAGAEDPTELMLRWGLEPHRRTAFADLSGGLRQRLFIALALLNRPEVVFFDELTEGLDPLARRQVWEAIRQVQASGTTVVLVTHFMDEAEVLCDRLAVFDDGRIIAEGSPEEIVRGHADTATVSFTPDEMVAGIERCPGVRHLTTDAMGRVTVEGHPEMVAYVCAALVGAGPPPADLRITQPNLEDAVLTIERGAVR